MPRMTREGADDMIAEMGTREVSRRLGAPNGLSRENRDIIERAMRAKRETETLTHQPALSITASTYTLSESLLETIINVARGEAAAEAMKYRP